RAWLPPLGRACSLPTIPDERLTEKSPSGGHLMDDTLCLRFFLEPLQPVHRRYAALRAFFVEGLSPQAAADRFGSTYHTVRRWVPWVRASGAQGPPGRLPPFRPSRGAGGPPVRPPPRSGPDRRNLPSRIAAT